MIDDHWHPTYDCQQSSFVIYPCIEITEMSMWIVITMVINTPNDVMWMNKNEQLDNSRCNVDESMTNDHSNL